MQENKCARLLTYVTGDPRRRALQRAAGEQEDFRPLSAYLAAGYRQIVGAGEYGVWKSGIKHDMAVAGPSPVPSARKEKSTVGVFAATRVKKGECPPARLLQSAGLRHVWRVSSW